MPPMTTMRKKKTSISGAMAPLWFRRKGATLLRTAAFTVWRLVISLALVIVTLLRPLEGQDFPRRVSAADRAELWQAAVVAGTFGDCGNGCGPGCGIVRRPRTPEGQSLRRIAANHVLPAGDDKC